MTYCPRHIIVVLLTSFGLAAGAAAHAGEITGRGFPGRSGQTVQHTAPASSPQRVQSYTPQAVNELATLAPLSSETPVVSTPVPLDTRAFEAQPLTFSENSRRRRGGGGEEKREFAMPSIWPALLSVMAVCGLFCAALYLVKKYLPGHRQLFSHPAMEVLGRTHLDQKRYVSLLRVGKRIVVVGVSPDEMRPLSEITDEEEITSIMEVARPKTEAGLTIFQKLFKRTVTDAEAAETRAMANVKAEQLGEQMEALRRRVREIGGNETPRRPAKATVDTIG